MSNADRTAADSSGMDEIQRSEQTIEQLSLGHTTSQDDDAVVRVLAAERDRVRRPFDPDAFDFFDGQLDGIPDHENVRIESIGLLAAILSTVSVLAGLYALTVSLFLAAILLGIGLTCLLIVHLLHRVR